MDKRQLVIESIQKLVSLNVSDSEIMDNLSDVGLTKEEASELIKEAKGIKSGSQIEENSVEKVIEKNEVQPKSSSKEVFDDTVKKLSMDDQVISQIPFVKKSSNNDSKKEGSLNENHSDEIINAVSKPVVNEKKISGDKIIKNDSKVSDVNSNKGDSKVSGVGDSVEVNKDDFKVSNVNVSNADSGVEVNKDNSKVSEVNTAVKGDKINNKFDLGSAVKEKFFKNSSSSTNVKKEDFVSQEKSEKEIDSNKNFIIKTNNFADKNKDVFDGNYSKNFESVNKMNLSLEKNDSFNDDLLKSSPDFEELWKKGIVVAVNTKLAEMKQLKEDIDLRINQSVDEAMRKELYQLRVLMDSQKELLISSNKEALDQKQKEITFIIDSKIVELKQYNKNLLDTLKLMEELKKQQQSSVDEIKVALEEAKKIKAQLLIEVNSELIKTKSQAQAFLDSAANQLNQMDERVNKTLELERNIAEGMFSQAEQKIEQITITRADELIEKMEVELNKLQATSKRISPDILDDKIRTLEKFRVDFIENMQKSLFQINSSIDELNKKNELAQKTLEEKTLAIDAKMEELTKFEKQFTQIIEKVLSTN